ncbi:MAG: hypothetical protein ACYTGX_09600 [Planctomycetota bacterium]|jgi:hypothetical protein
MIRAIPLSLLAAGALLCVGCGDDTLPKPVYEFQLAANPVSLAAAEVCMPLDGLVAKSIEQQYEDVAGHQRRWANNRSAVEALLRQGLERLEAPTRTEVCTYASGRAEYAKLSDAVAKLARSLGKSRDVWVEFAGGLERAEILEAGIAPPRSDLEAERDKRIDELIAQVNGLVTKAARARVEQARLFLANGDTAIGFEAVADAQALITEFGLAGEVAEAILADAEKLSASAQHGDTAGG